MADKSINQAIKRFGQKVKSLRLVKGISQEELAAIAGVHRTYIGMVERGEKNVTLLTMIRLAEALETTPADLVRQILNTKDSSVG